MFIHSVALPKGWSPLSCFPDSGIPDGRQVTISPWEPGCPIGLRSLNRAPDPPHPRPCLLSWCLWWCSTPATWEFCIPARGSAFSLGLQPDLCSCLQGAPLPPQPACASLEAVNSPQISGTKPCSQSASTLLGTPFPSLHTCCFLPVVFQSRPWGTSACHGSPRGPAPSPLSQALALPPQGAGPPWLPAASRRPPWLGGPSPHRISGCHCALAPSLSRSPRPARCKTFELTPCFLEFW